MNGFAGIEGLRSKSGNTFLNFGAPYPAQTFTGCIPASTPLASDLSLQPLQGKKVKITGTIQLYRGIVCRCRRFISRL
jgi:hypothetical protein